MRTLALIVALAALVVACSPPCETATIVARSVCVAADAGALTPGAAFTVFATHNFNSRAACTVSVDGGAITLSLVSAVGTFCAAGTGNGARAPQPAAQPEPCEVPALPAGSYVIDTTPTPTAFTLPDAGFATCP